MGYFRASKYFSVLRGTLERCVKDSSRSPEELVIVHLGRTVLPSELEKTCGVLHNHGPKTVLTETSGHRTHDFSVDNKKWFETSI
jgi:hypothetical protein